MTFYRLRHLLCIICSIYSLTATAQASEQAAYTSNINKMLDSWSTSQHTYVKGNIDVKKKDLDQLEQWLDVKGQNWTVILMRNAKEEQWQDSRGNTYYGMDAVENAVARGLSNKTKFLKLRNATTGEKNGAIFILFLDERKFSYFASDAYDVRGLGEAHWRGNLDAQAIRAMRRGRGIVDAAMSTVASIDKKFTESLRREAEREAHRKTELASAKAWVAREGHRQKILIDELEKEVGRLLSHPDVKHNDLANPGYNDWREIINNTSTNNDPFIAKNAIRKIASEISSHRSNIQLWNEDHHTMDLLTKQISEFTPYSKQPPTEIEAAQAALDEAHELHTTGKISYRESLLHAQQLYLTLEADKIELQRLQDIKQRQQEAMEKQQKMAITAGSGATGVGLVGLGIYSNRRRRKQKKIAEDLYQAWKESMRKRVDQLFKTMDRAGIIVGSERDLPQRGYEGETLAESINAIRNIDKAFILSSSVHSTLEKAEELIFPSNAFGKTSNVFRRANYDEAVELLERKPLQADPKNEKMKVADRGEDAMLGDKTKASKVKLKFTELIAEFDQTLLTAQSSLDLVETSWETIADRCETLAKNLDTIESEEIGLEKSALSDGMYLLDNLFDHWLPRSKQHHEEGIKLGKNDPVKALRTDISRADLMAEEMNDTISLTKKLRKTELTPILELADQLKRLHRNDHWVHQKLIHLNQELEQLALEGVAESVAEQIATQAEQVFALKPRVQHAHKLANSAHSDLPKSIESSHSSTAATRSKIARDLSLTSDDILREHDKWNPDNILHSAELFRIRTQDMIDQGHIRQAQDQADQASAEITEANRVIEETIMAHNSYDALLKEAQTLSKDAENLTQEGIQVMTKLTANYHSTALLIDPTDADFGNLTETEEALLGSSRQLEKDVIAAKQNHTKGFVLTARHSLRNGKLAHQHITGLHQLITSRKEELHDLEQKNTNTLRSLNTEKSALGEVTSRHYITRSTQQYFEQLENQMEAVEHTVHAPHGESNPYKAHSLLEETKDRIKALESQIEADKELFTSSSELAKQLHQRYKNGHQLIQESQRDGIPDSRATKESIDQIDLSARQLIEQATLLDKPHQDWQEIYSNLQHIGQLLAKGKATLKQELHLAQQALSSLESARTNVSRASRWSGSYGVRISGSYGRNSLHESQNALSSGQYQQASSLASSAISSARNAISSAESEVASIRRSRAAEERRKRMARRSSSSSFSSFGGGSSGSSGSRSSFSSGSSRSSGSSSSGFSRSGW